MDTKRVIYHLYEVFQLGLGADEFSFEPNPTTDKVVDRFIKRWEDNGIKEQSLGLTFLYDYFCDAYNCWTQMGEELKEIPLVQILGEPQYKRWKNRIEEYKWSYRIGILSKIDIPSLTEMKVQFTKYPKRGLQIEEEYERERFHNQDKALDHCSISTTLVDPKSKWCTICIWRSQCIERLKHNDKKTAMRRKFLKL